MKLAIQCLAVCLLVSPAMPGAIAAPAPSTSDVLSRWDRDEHPDLRGVIVLRDGRTITADDPYADGYGYFWYRKNHRIGDAMIPVSFASGNGGNKIYVVPACRLVVAITSAAYGRGYGQRRSEAILKAVLGEQVQAGACRTDRTAK